MEELPKNETQPEYVNPNKISFRRWYVMSVTFVVTIFIGANIAKWINVGGMAHRQCFPQNPTILWIQMISDIITAIDYFLVPLGLIILLRALPQVFFSPLLVRLFATFILSCSVVHIMDVVLIWYPEYVLQTMAKIVLAIGSTATVYVIFFRSKPALQEFVTSLRSSEGRSHE